MPSRYKQYKNEKLPKRIHFIWVGGPIPVKYVNNVVNFNELVNLNNLSEDDDRFELSLWVDNKEDFERGLDEASKTTPNIIHKTANLKIRAVNELSDAIKTNKFFLGTDPLFPLEANEEDRVTSFLTFLNREKVGFKNLAAAADFLRYTILLIEGGYYLDVDTQLDYKKSVKLENHLIQFKGSKLESNSSDLGFIANVYYKSRPIDLIKEDYREKLIEVSGYNDQIACFPDHDLMKTIIFNILKQYKSLDLDDKTTGLDLYTDRDLKNKTAIELEEIKSKRDKNRITAMDAKRFPIEKRLSIYERGERTEGTISASGPGIYCSSIQEYVNKLILTMPKGNYDYTILDSMTVRNNRLLNPSKEKHGINMTTKSDQNWIHKSKQKLKSFDDSYLAEKRLFSTKKEPSPLKEDSSLIGWYIEQCSLLLNEARINKAPLEKIEVLKEAITILSSHKNAEIELQNFYSIINEKRHLFKKFSLPEVIRNNWAFSNYLYDPSEVSNQKNLENDIPNGRNTIRSYAQDRALAINKNESTERKLIRELLNKIDENSLNPKFKKDSNEKETHKQTQNHKPSLK